MLIGPRELGRVLIVEDNVPLRTAIAALLRDSGAEVLEAGTERDAIALLNPPPDLIICDVYLPDGSALKILETALHLSPEPVKIAVSGHASAEEAFQLAKLGVLAYLAKPFSLAELSGTIERVLEAPPDIDTMLRASVGQVPMRELQQRVRKVMVGQALALTRGSRSGAARLLDVSRQAIQQITRGNRERAAAANSAERPRVTRSRSS
ncbi:MAG: response regulator [Myxococcota bacterium]|jgi:DNA-binding NtrC family response regulator